MPDREPPLGQHDLPGFCDVCKTEAVLEQIEDERLRGADIAVPGRIEPLPVSQGDLVVPGDLVAEFEARENPVAFIRLVRQVEGRGAGYDFRRQQGAGDFDRGEVQTGGPARLTGTSGGLGHREFLRAPASRRRTR